LGLHSPVLRDVAQRKAGVAARWLAIAVTAVLGACQSPGLDIDPSLQSSGQTTGAPVLTPNPNGEVVGNGQVRIALLIPKSAPGNGAAAANDIRNGALLAIADFGSSLQIVIKDDAGQPAGAQAAAAEAVREGASLIIGPLFASTVSAASGVTQPAGRSMFAFSSDTSTARRGVYLLSFTPQEDTKRIVSYAASQGRRSVLAFLPNNAEGQVREGALRSEAGASGMNVQIVRYDRTMPSIETAITQALPLIATADAIYVPEGFDVPNTIFQSLRRKSVDLVGKLVMGSGNWESVRFTEPTLEGAVYPGRDTAGLASFDSAYTARYGGKPSVQAALGYEAVTLAAILLSQNGPDRAYRPETIENPAGYSGINGVFRLRQDGTAERGLAVYQVERGVARIVAPAPGRFGRR